MLSHPSSTPLPDARKHRHWLEDAANTLDKHGANATFVGRLSESFAQQTTRALRMDEEQYRAIFGHENPESWFDRRDREQGITSNDEPAPVFYH